MERKLNPSSRVNIHYINEVFNGIIEALIFEFLA